MLLVALVGFQLSTMNLKAHEMFFKFVCFHGAMTKGDKVSNYCQFSCEKTEIWILPYCSDGDEKNRKLLIFFCSRLPTTV